MTTHTNCSHPATKADRAACRKARTPQGDTTPRVTVAKAQAEAVPAALIAKIEWERETCSRCAGSGQYPSPAWQGVCLGCNGLGRKLTRAGKAALKKYDAYLQAHHTKAYIELEPGDVTRDNRGRRLTVVNVDTNIRRGGSAAIGVEGTDGYVTYSRLVITVNFKRESWIVGPYDRTMVPPQGEALQAAFRHVANMKGCHVTYAD